MDDNLPLICELALQFVKKGEGVIINDAGRYCGILESFDVHSDMGYTWLEITAFNVLSGIRSTLARKYKTLEDRSALQKKYGIWTLTIPAEPKFPDNEYATYHCGH